MYQADLWLVTVSQSQTFAKAGSYNVKFAYALVCLLSFRERIEVRESVAKINPVEVKVKNAKHDNTWSAMTRA